MSTADAEHNLVVRLHPQPPEATQHSEGPPEDTMSLIMLQPRTSTLEFPNPELPADVVPDEVHGIHAGPPFDPCGRLTKSHVDLRRGSVTCSLDDPTMEPPLRPPPDALGQPHRPFDQGPSHEYPAWFHALWSIVHNHGHIEMAEEGPVAYFNSHYISHQGHRRNAEPRPVRFDFDFSTWEAMLRWTWHDLEDATSPMNVVIVDPTPPVTMFQGTIGTLLLIQHPLPTSCSMCSNKRTWKTT